MTASTGAPTRTTALLDGGVRFATADTRHPAVALLSNGRYGVMITAAGGGYSTWRDLDVTRWREDGTRDCWGQFCYVRDLGERAGWSVGHQPLCRTADDYEAVFHPWRADFRRQDGDIETRLAVCVSPDHDAEVRVVTVVNHGNRPRDLDVTSYAEVCLNHRRADQAHPAFAKLFLETEYRRRSGALLCRRRPRAADQKPVWAVHVSAAEGRIEYETDRARFLGRGRTPANPAALDPDGTLSGTTGPVLDPVFSLRRSCDSPPGPRRGSPSSPGPPTAGRKPSPWPSSFRRSRPPSVLSNAPRPRPGRTAGPRPDGRRRGLVQPPGGGGAVYRPGAAFGGRRCRQPAGTAGPLAVRHLRRPADRSGSTRDGRRRRVGPPARAMARLRPPPRHGPRPRHPRRAAPRGR